MGGYVPLKRQRTAPTKRVVDALLLAVNSPQRKSALKSAHKAFDHHHTALHDESMLDHSAADALCIKLGFALSLTTSSAETRAASVCSTAEATPIADREDEVCNILSVLCVLYERCSDKAVEESFDTIGETMLDLLSQILLSSSRSNPGMTMETIEGNCQISTHDAPLQRFIGRKREENCLKLLHILASRGNDLTIKSTLTKRPTLLTQVAKIVANTMENALPCVFEKATCSWAIRFLSCLGTSSKPEVRSVVIHHPGVLTCFGCALVVSQPNQRSPVETSEGFQHNHFPNEKVPPPEHTDVRAAVENVMGFILGGPDPCCSRQSESQEKLDCNSQIVTESDVQREDSIGSSQPNGPHVDTDGKVTASEKNVDASDMCWSRDGSVSSPLTTTLHERATIMSELGRLLNETAGDGTGGSESVSYAIHNEAPALVALANVALQNIPENIVRAVLRGSGVEEGLIYHLKNATNVLLECAEETGGENTSAHMEKRVVEHIVGILDALICLSTSFERHLLDVGWLINLILHLYITRKPSLGGPQLELRTKEQREKERVKVTVVDRDGLVICGVNEMGKSSIIKDYFGHPMTESGQDTRDLTSDPEGDRDHRRTALLHKTLLVTTMVERALHFLELLISPASIDVLLESCAQKVETLMFQEEDGLFTQLIHISHDCTTADLRLLSSFDSRVAAMPASPVTTPNDKATTVPLESTIQRIQVHLYQMRMHALGIVANVCQVSNHHVRSMISSHPRLLAALTETVHEEYQLQSHNETDTREHEATSPRSPQVQTLYIGKNTLDKHGIEMSTIKTKESVAIAMQNISATDNEVSAKMASRKRLVLALVDLIDKPQPEGENTSTTVKTRRCAAGALQNLAFLESNAHHLSSYGGQKLFESLAVMASSEVDTEARIRSSAALRNLACNDGVADRMAKSTTAVHEIAKAASGVNETVGMHASGTLKKLLPLVGQRDFRNILSNIASSPPPTSMFCAAHELILR